MIITGLYAACNDLNDYKINKFTSISKLLQLLGLSRQQDHWWSDDELISIADYYIYDAYVYNDKQI